MIIDQSLRLTASVGTASLLAAGHLPSSQPVPRNNCCQ